MFNQFLFPIVLMLSSFNPGEEAYDVEAVKVDKVDTDFLKIMKPNASIREDHLLNEEIMDMVQIYNPDSIIPSRFQRHRVAVVGSIIKVLGWRWQVINYKREKFVGTERDEIRVPNKPRFTEYDVNWDLVPHLQKYQDMLYNAYQYMRRLHRHDGKKDRDYSKPPFTYPTEETLHSGGYHMHCEISPPEPQKKELDSLFYPTVRPSKLKTHPNFGEDKVTVGMYGAYIADCNHGCHPEIHPYEWLWWLDLDPKKENLGNQKRWMVGFMREYSSRFKKWAKRPRRGIVSVPFILNTSGERKIHIDHLVVSELVSEGFADLEVQVPENAMQFDFTNKELKVQGGQSIKIEANKEMNNPALKFWLSDVRGDDQWLTGYFNIAVSVKECYTARITY